MGRREGGWVGGRGECGTVMYPDFPLDFTEFLVFLSILSHVSIVNCEAEQVYLMLQLKIKEVTINFKPQTLKQNLSLQNPKQ